MGYPSIAHMWRTVYQPDLDSPPYIDRPEFERRVPGDQIVLKECGCCESKEFTEINDYICLWCRYGDL